MQRRYLPTGWTSLVHGDVFIVQSSQGGAPAVAEAAINAGARSAATLGRRCITLFPEGGFFRKRHARSVEFLKKQDAAAVHPRFTALPRSGGFCSILRVMEQDLEGVLDITIRYEAGGAKAPEIPSLFMGTDEAVYLDAEWIVKRDVPVSSDAAAVHAWLTQQFARKDQRMAALPALYKPISSVRAGCPALPAAHHITSPCITGVHHRVSPRRARPRVPAHHVQRRSRGRPAPCPHRSLRAVLCGRVPSHALAPQHVGRLHRCCCRCSSCHVHHRCLITLPPAICMPAASLLPCKGHL